jgi:hypothetical protein
MRYIEFFFGDFWHWLGALIFLMVIVDGFFVNLFRIINNAVIRKRQSPERDPMIPPTEAPQGTIWPYNGNKYIRIDDTWVKIDDGNERNSKNSSDLREDSL